MDIARDWSAVIFEEPGQTLEVQGRRTLRHTEWGDASGAQRRFASLPAPQDVIVPAALWHGDADNNSPLAAATCLSRTIPNASPTIFPDEGRFFIRKRWGEIIRQLTDAPGR